MSRKLWSGLLVVLAFIVFVQIIYNLRMQSIREREAKSGEIVIDLSTFDKTIPAQELKTPEINSTQAVLEALPKNITQLQQALKKAGFDPGSIDGKYGPKTISAVKRFQKTHDLKVDGKVGKNTWKLLKEYLK